MLEQGGAAPHDLQATATDIPKLGLANGLQCHLFRLPKCQAGLSAPRKPLSHQQARWEAIASHVFQSAFGSFL